MPGLEPRILRLRGCRTCIRSAGTAARDGTDDNGHERCACNAHGRHEERLPFAEDTSIDARNCADRNLYLLAIPNCRDTRTLRGATDLHGIGCVCPRNHAAINRLDVRAHEGLQRCRAIVGKMKPNLLTHADARGLTRQVLIARGRRRERREHCGPPRCERSASERRARRRRNDVGSIRKQSWHSRARPFLLERPGIHGARTRVSVGSPRDRSARFVLTKRVGCAPVVTHEGRSAEF